MRELVVGSGPADSVIEFDDGYAIAKIAAPARALGRTLADSALRSRYGIPVVGVKMPGEDFTYARPETMVEPGALLIVAGQTDQVQRFASIS